MTQTTRHAVRCPHPDCEGTLHVPDTLPGGDYPCICKAATVHLLWATSMKGERAPMLSMVKKRVTEADS